MWTPSYTHSSLDDKPLLIVDKVDAVDTDTDSLVIPKCRTEYTLKEARNFIDDIMAILKRLDDLANLIPLYQSDESKHSGITQTMEQMVSKRSPRNAVASALENHTPSSTTLTPLQSSESEAPSENYDDYGPVASVPSTDKVRAIREYPEPNSFKQLRRLSGLVNYYRRFIHHCAHIMQPMTDLLRGGERKFQFTEAARAAFVKLKDAVAELALLAHLIRTHHCPFTFGRELLAIYLGIRHSVEGRTFAIYTDHKPLTYSLNTSSDRYSPREVRHLDYISQFTTDIRHVPGAENTVADALSRIHNLSAAADYGIDLAAMPAAQATDPEIEHLRQKSSLTIQPVPLTSSEGTILCDTSQGTPRPVVPAPFRRAVFETLHNLSHPGIRASVKLVTERFVWPKINHDVRNWSRSCLRCQRSKVHRHTKSPHGTFPLPDARFHHVHVDLVGPLPPSNGSIYLLTCVDRFTRWPAAIPLPNCSSETVASAFLERWVAQFGCPAVVTTDRGSHFEGHFAALLNTLGSKHIRTTAYHPAANGMVERFHRQLKAALSAHANPSWKEALPLVLLGLRNTVKEDLNATAAELVFGCTLRLPGELVSPAPSAPYDYGSYTARLAHHMRKLRPVQPREHSSTVHMHAKLSSCTHVFLRTDELRRPLQPPYTGPYRVLARDTKTFTVSRNGKREVVSVDRLKPAFTEEPSAIPASTNSVPRPKPPVAAESVPAPEPPAVVSTPATPTPAPTTSRHNRLDNPDMVRGETTPIDLSYSTGQTPPPFLSRVFRVGQPAAIDKKRTED
ncbi:uncharacterized protein DEA37_0012599 [Paragonimus westermani]|uniref:Integrase catalytic domain-containing protein n=1 Tax=Paragonimus westermani TaxID=34504 RepID=A0A5J4NEK4_9TREM|nr:uncharacterized protein DEA37_0012599 [Paragonimus westermani]